MSKEYQAVLAEKLSSISPNVIMTSELLARKYGAMLTTSQLAELLHIKQSTVTQKICKGTFKIPCARYGNNWYATAFDVAMFLEQEKQITEV